MGIVIISNIITVSIFPYYKYHSHIDIKLSLPLPTIITVTAPLALPNS